MALAPPLSHQMSSLSAHPPIQYAYDGCAKLTYCFSALAELQRATQSERIAISAAAAIETPTTAADYWHRTRTGDASENTIRSTGHTKTFNARYAFSFVQSKRICRGEQYTVDEPANLSTASEPSPWRLEQSAELARSNSNTS